MKMICQNIGLIESSEININGITVLAAPNDSGKSSIAKTLYMFLEVLNNYDNDYDSLRQISERDEVRKLFLWLNRTLNINQMEAIANQMNQHDFLEVQYDSSSNSLDYDSISFLMKNGDVTTKSRELGETYFATFKEIYLREVAHDKVSDEVIQHFDTILSRYSCSDSDKFKVVLESKISSYFARDIVTRSDTYLESRFSLVDTKSGAEGSEIIDCVFTNNSVISLDFQKQINEFSKVLYFDSFIDLEVYSKNQNNIRAMLRKSGRDIRSSSDNCFTSMIDEEEELNPLRPDILSQEELMNEINKIVGGQIKRDSKHVVFSKGDYQFSLKNTATGLKIFGALQLLLQNFKLTPDVFMIIDEPETNLHPVWQVEIAKIIVLMNKKLGVHFFINSHSSFFIEAVNLYSKLYDNNDNINYYLIYKNMESSFSVKDTTENIQAIYNQLNGALDKLDSIASDILKGKGPS